MTEPKDKRLLTPEEILTEKIKDVIAACIAWNFPSFADPDQKKMSWKKAVKEIKALFPDPVKVLNRDRPEVCPDCKGEKTKLVRRPNGREIRIDYHCPTCKGVGTIPITIREAIEEAMG